MSLSFLTFVHYTSLLLIIDLTLTKIFQLSSTVPASFPKSLLLPYFFRFSSISSTNKPSYFMHLPQHHTHNFSSYTFFSMLMLSLLQHTITLFNYLFFPLSCYKIIFSYSCFIFNYLLTLPTISFFPPSFPLSFLPSLIVSFPSPPFPNLFLFVSPFLSFPLTSFLSLLSLLFQFIRYCFLPAYFISLSSIPPFLYFFSRRLFRSLTWNPLLWVYSGHSGRFLYYKKDLLEYTRCLERASGVRED